MAGTIFGLGLSQQTDAKGVPLIGCLLYVYAANTSTPSTIYSNFSLTDTHTWPLAGDSAGRLPAFWLSDGDYRVRLTTSAGVEVFDEQSITAIGSSSSGSSGSSQDSTTLIQTGDIIWNAITGTKAGFARCNGRTIGSGSSSASERANSDTQDLFEYLWNNLSDSLATVSSGRGATSTADFNANKTITLPDLRGRSLFGLSDMGNSDSSRLTAGTPTAVSSGGAEKQTIAQANLPNVNLSAASLTGSVATTITNGTLVVRNQNKTNFDCNAGGHTVIESLSFTSATVSLADGTVTFGGNVPLGGSGTTLATTPPYYLGTFYIKL